MADAITTIANKIVELQAQYDAAIAISDNVEAKRLADIIADFKRAYNVDMTANAGNASTIYGGTPVVQTMVNTNVPPVNNSSSQTASVGYASKNTMLYLALATAIVFLLFRRR